MRSFIFFDLGQTLIDEWSFVAYFDDLLFKTLNGYGARIDRINYIALRNNLIQDRKFGTFGFLELVSLMSKLTLPRGYESTINCILKEDLLHKKRELIKLFDEVPKIIPFLSKKYSLGIISNNSSGSANLLKRFGLDKYFEVVCLSESIGFRKPDHKIFREALASTNSPIDKCIMVGDRLDIDIMPANELGMKTIRAMNSLYKIQRPNNEKEVPLFTINSLAELPEILSNIP
ncbi:HAD family hydrolase [Candidatus Nitrosocosmicus franklandus]|uniref:Pyrimidine 5'-nucleotidase YjjG n=1 Tax=Candidatus Nitrosocosmicus franklandianus TaxID=1798806 RepID=A0A484IBF2_9ARCH|nr:HAD family hydrolase [Candidatus Nitrosocosmicus franklandus]VFJ14115.1 Pyrimidine 5'-nucleotidase YjjG [Candidatus Nitrosocosmicus franklandus]